MGQSPLAAPHFSSPSEKTGSSPLPAEEERFITKRAADDQCRLTHELLSHRRKFTPGHFQELRNQALNVVPM